MIEDVYGDNVVIYRFWPHGSKKLENLLPARRDPADSFMLPHVYCHDQEPLCFDYYESQRKEFGDLELARLRAKITGTNDRIHANLRYPIDINDFALLIHSEQRSPDVEKYKQNFFIPIYYWSHAVIAQDWYRSAEYFRQHKSSDKKFLIYNRAWSGSREYRLKFVELLMLHDLVDFCQCNLNSVEPEIQVHYSNYNFVNQNWKPTTVIDHAFPATLASSNSSADFEIKDYENTDIEIVLETLFDDQRLHLTEKILRPIALGQPFILASTPGSLQYLRKYGFQTFSEVWNEDYDQEPDHQQRLIKIVKLMKSIVAWSDQEKTHKLSIAQQIAEHNKKHFFSKEFFSKVIDEFKSNTDLAFKTFCKQNNHQRWIHRCQAMLDSTEIQQYLEQKNSKLWNTTLLNSTIEYAKKSAANTDK